MQWEGREESKNVEDQRGMGRTAGIALGGGSILILLLAMLFGVDPQKLANIVGQPGQQPDQQQADRPRDPAEEKQASFTKVVFNDTEIIWDELFRKMGKTYEKPILRLFTGEVQTACGGADAAVGPFYCPGDSRVFIDLSFYQLMQDRLNSPGEFARAYVVAHEVGHHVQRLLGYSEIVDRIRATQGKVEANHASVRLELQADYLAGVWAHHAQKKFKYLEAGDVESALNSAKQIGDDTLQKNAGRRVVPDSFTHGTSKQRERWFRLGFQTGDVAGAAQLFKLPYEDL
ncbi:MAG: neutral zinc metallopeptidase [Gemmataceae bacterium]